MKKMIPLCAVLALMLSGCAVVEKFSKPKPQAAPVVAEVPVLGVGATPASLDTTTPAEKAAAVVVPSGAELVLGKVVVGLGSPAEQGFWLKSALVVVAGKGRVVTDSGASVAVDLLPTDGPALLSLAAYRALGLGLTDLPEVTVYGK
jgi:hypothetical protein